MRSWREVIVFVENNGCPEKTIRGRFEQLTTLSLFLSFYHVTLVKCLFLTYLSTAWPSICPTGFGWISRIVYHFSGV